MKRKLCLVYCCAMVSCGTVSHTKVNSNFMDTFYSKSIKKFSESLKESEDEDVKLVKDLFNGDAKEIFKIYGKENKCYHFTNPGKKNTESLKKLIDAGFGGSWWKFFGRGNQFSKDNNLQDGNSKLLVKEFDLIRNHKGCVSSRKLEIERFQEEVGNEVNVAYEIEEFKKTANNISAALLMTKQNSNLSHSMIEKSIKNNFKTIEGILALFDKKNALERFTWYVKQEFNTLLEKMCVGECDELQIKHFWKKTSSGGDLIHIIALEEKDDEKDCLKKIYKAFEAFEEKN